MGAETVANAPIPAMAPFCTSSKEQRLDIGTKPVESRYLPGQRADQLVECRVAAHVLARQEDCSVYGAPAAAWTVRLIRLIGWCSGSTS